MYDAHASTMWSFYLVVVVEAVVVGGLIPVGAFQTPISKPFSFRDRRYAVEPLLATNAAVGPDNTPTVPGLPEWDPTNWTSKRLHNTPWFRSAAILTALGLAGYTAGAPLAKLSSKGAATLHVLSYGIWFGSVVYTTFIGGVTMYKNLPRKTFGMLQSKLFPKFFNICAVTIAIQLLTLRNIPALISNKVTTTLGTSFVMTLLNLFLLEPKATKVMFDRYKLEAVSDGKDTVEYNRLVSTFGKLHGLSSLANLIALCCAVVHGFYMASALTV